MNLWLRFLWILLTAKLRGPIALPDGASELFFRVHLHDSDLNWHMNNGRYLTIMDLGRIDLALRTRIGVLVLKNRWMPVANAVMIRFRREMPVFEPFCLTTRILSWNDTHVLIEQKFTFTRGERKGQVAAHALFRGGFYDRKTRAYVPTGRIINALTDHAVESPPLTPETEAFLAADQVMREAVAPSNKPGGA